MDRISCEIYRLDGSEFTFRCQRCGYEKQINGKNFQKLKCYRKVRVKCKCGAVKRLILEKRKKDRTAVLLSGVFYYTGSDGKPDFKDININNISTRGMCFMVTAESHREPDAGKKVLIVFKPSSTANSLIKKEAFIKNFQDNYYHVEFKENITASDDLSLKILLYSKF